MLLKFYMRVDEVHISHLHNEKYHQFHLLLELLWLLHQTRKYLISGYFLSGRKKGTFQIRFRLVGLSFLFQFLKQNQVLPTLRLHRPATSPKNSRGSFFTTLFLGLFFQRADGAQVVFFHAGQGLGFVLLQLCLGFAFGLCMGNLARVVQ